MDLSQSQKDSLLTVCVFIAAFILTHYIIMSAIATFAFYHGLKRSRKNKEVTDTPSTEVSQN